MLVLEYLTLSKRLTDIKEQSIVMAPLQILFMAIFILQNSDFCGGKLHMELVRSRNIKKIKKLKCHKSFGPSL